VFKKILNHQFQNLIAKKIFAGECRFVFEEIQPTEAPPAQEIPPSEPTELERSTDKTIQAADEKALITEIQTALSNSGEANAEITPEQVTDILGQALPKLVKEYLKGQEIKFELPLIGEQTIDLSSTTIENLQISFIGNQIKINFTANVNHRMIPNLPMEAFLYIDANGDLILRSITNEGMLARFINPQLEALAGQNLTPDLQEYFQTKIGRPSISLVNISQISVKGVQVKLKSEQSQPTAMTMSPIQPPAPTFSPITTNSAPVSPAGSSEPSQSLSIAKAYQTFTAQSPTTPSAPVASPETTSQTPKATNSNEWTALREGIKTKKNGEKIIGIQLSKNSQIKTFEAYEYEGHRGKDMLRLVELDDNGRPCSTYDISKNLIESEVAAILDPVPSQETFQQNFPTINTTNDPFTPINQPVKTQEITIDQNGKTEKYLLVSKNPDPNNNNKPQQVAIYKKDSANHIIEAKYYNATGNLTKVENPPVKDNNKQPGDLIDVDPKTGEEKRATEELIALASSNKKYNFSKYPPSRYELFFKALNDVMLIWGDFKSRISRGTIDEMVAYSQPDRVSIKDRKNYARAKYCLCDDIQPWAYEIFSSQITVAEFTGGKKRDPKQFFNSPSQYQAFLNDPNKNKLTKDMLNKRILGKHFKDIRNQFANINPSIKKYPKDEILENLFLSLLINTNSKLMLSEKAQKEREKNLGQNLSTLSFDDQVKPETLPANLKISDFLGDQNEMHEIMNYHHSIDSKAFKKHLIAVGFSSANLSNHEYLNALQQTYLNQINLYYPEYSFSVVDFMDSLAVKTPTENDNLNEAFTDASHDSFIDFEEYENQDQVQLINDVSKYLQGNTLSLTNLNPPQTIDLTPAMAKILCLVPAKDFVNAYQMPVNDQNIEMVLGKNNGVTQILFPILKLISEDFKIKFKDNQPAPEELTKQTLADLFQSRSYLYERQSKANETETKDEAEKTAKTKAEIALIGDTPKNPKLTDIHDKFNADQFINGLADISENKLNVLYDFKIAQLRLFAEKGIIDGEDYNKLRPIPIDVVRYILIKAVSANVDLTDPAKNLKDAIGANHASFLVQLFIPLNTLAEKLDDKQKYRLPYQNFTKEISKVFNINLPEFLSMNKLKALL